MIDDDELRGRLRAGLETAPRVDPAIERVTRRARGFRFRRWSAVAVSALIVAAGVVVPVWTLAPVHGNGPPSSLGTAQDTYGIHLDVPSGWDERISYESTD